MVMLIRTLAAAVAMTLGTMPAVAAGGVSAGLRRGYG